MQGYQRWVIVLFQHPQGMRLERHCYGRTANDRGPFDHLMEKRLMAQVHTVKIAYRNDRSCEWFGNVIQVFDQFHIGKPI